MPHVIIKSLFILYLFLFHIHTVLVWGGGGWNKSFPLVRRAAEVNFIEQSLLIAWGSLTLSFTVNVCACCASLHKPHAGMSSVFAVEKSWAASLRKAHYHRAKC